MFTPNPRAPHLTETKLHQALEGLDAKIKTLLNRVHATAAGSANTYQQHAEALTTKRAQLAEQLRQSPTPADGSEPSAWALIRRGIEDLSDDVRILP